MSILNTSVSGMLADSNWLSSISHNVANSNDDRLQERRNRCFLPGRPDFRHRPGLWRRRDKQASLNSLQGNIVSTSTSTDLAIQGSGFFVVSNSSAKLFLTRNGSSPPTPLATSSTAPAII